MKKFLFLTIIIVLNVELMGQFMYGTDNSIRSAIAPGSAGYKNQLYASWLSYQSYFGQIKSANSIAGGDAQLDLGLRRTNGYLGIGGFFQQRDLEYWKETSFNINFASSIEISKGVFAALGFRNTLFQYGQPEGLTREEFLDDIFLNIQETQAIYKLSWGLSIHSEKFYFDFGHINAFTRVFSGSEGAKVKESPSFVINTSYIFKSNQKYSNSKDYGIRPGLMFECSGLFNPNEKFMWLTKPNIEFLFWEDKIWAEYTLIYGNSLNRSEFANRILVGAGTHLNLSFAYTFGNSKLYTNSQGNFELIVVYDINRREKDKKNNKYKGSASCKSVFKLPKSYSSKNRRRRRR